MFKHIKFLVPLLTCVGLLHGATPATYVADEENKKTEEQGQNWFAPSNGEQYIVGFDKGNKDYPVIIRQSYVGLSCYLRNVSNPLYRRVQSFGTSSANIFFDAITKTVYLWTFKKPYKIKMRVETDREDNTVASYEKCTFVEFIDKKPESEDDAKECAKSICYFLESINNRPTLQGMMPYTNAYYIFLNLLSCIDQLLAAADTLEAKRGFLLGIQEYAVAYFKHYGFVSPGFNASVIDLLKQKLKINTLDEYHYSYPVGLNPGRRAAMGSNDMDKLYEVLTKVDNEIKKLNSPST